MQSEDSGSSEKLVEIAKMGKVYASAILNIGATSAKSPLDGLFTTTESRRGYRDPRVIDLTDQTQLEPYTYLLYPASCRGVEQTSLFSGSIFSRAWCMQERFLCPRMLHFWEHGIFWECNAMYSESQRFPTQSFPVLQGMNYLPFSLRMGSKTLANEHLRDWDQIVATYSAMGLSRPDKDKLAACGAVAKMISELIDDEYIAGHFRGSLVSSLTWMIDHNRQTRDMGTLRSRIWRAPSWSWASMDGAVSIGGHYDDDGRGGGSEPEMPQESEDLDGWKASEQSYEQNQSKHSNDVAPVAGRKRTVANPCVGPCTEVMSLEIELVDPSNPYGSLTSAAITIQGPVTEVGDETVHSAHPREWNGAVRWVDNQINVNFDDPSEPRRNLAILLTHIWRGTVYRSGGLRERDLAMSGPGTVLSGVVLVLFRKGLGGESDVYRRVGALQGARLGDSLHRYDYKWSEFKRP